MMLRVPSAKKRTEVPFLMRSAAARIEAMAASMFLRSMTMNSPPFSQA